MTDEELRAAYGRAMAERPATRAQCPDPDALIALVGRTGSETARLEILDHTMSCAACRQEFELLRAIDAGEQRATNSERLALPARWRQPVVLALAASLVLAVGVGPGREWWRERDPDAMRGDASVVAVVSPVAGATASPGDQRFVWRAVSGAARYTVELLDADGTLRLAATTADTSTVLSRMSELPAAEYRWWVRAELPGGERRSEPRILRVER